MLKLTGKASADLENIFEHYKDLVGAEQAKAIINDVVAQSSTLESMSASTDLPTVQELKLKRWPFLTTYQVTPESIEILGFLHQNNQAVNQPVYRTTTVKASSSVDVSGLRCYDKVVEGITYSVPRGISREARGNAWVVRVIKNKRNALLARFSDQSFGGTLKALESAIIHLVHSGHAWLGGDVLRLDEYSAVHWRKRSGVGLCAVAYVISKKPGRGETFFVSTYKRVESGRGMEKLRAKLIETLECSYTMRHEVSAVPEAIRQKLDQEIDLLMRSEEFQTFLEAGKRKADQIAVNQYVESISGLK
ncbi:type II toxin-antitoxin system RelE/ParE family toxin [Pseudomonas sp. NPDC089734]|uniref:type II toxin-antitoxin system RelE/ParE family toxin n=1 Tax=Pseudomonas sp. NPDC089734 TaxID=3364469 RepID=UPI00380754DF